MNVLPVILDGSKFKWYTDAGGSSGLGWTGDHLQFPLGGWAPSEVAVRSHRTGKVVVFSLVEVDEDDDGNVTINYATTLSDGRRVDLGIGVG